jgi:hypothetical protein
MELLQKHMECIDRLPQMSRIPVKSHHLLQDQPLSRKPHITFGLIGFGDKSYEAE